MYKWRQTGIVVTTRPTTTMWAASQHSVNYLDDLHYNQTVSDKSGHGLVKTGTGMTGARDATRHHQQVSEEVETTPAR